MTSRRLFISSSVAAGLAVSTLGCQQAALQPARRRTIVDSQVHLWTPESPQWRWVPGAVAQLPGPFLAEDLVSRMDAAGVDRAILTPPSWVGDRNDYVLEAAQRHPRRFAVMGRIALRNPQSAALLPRWKDQPGMLGVRLTFLGATAAWLADGTADWFWPAAEKAGLPVMFLAPEKGPEFARIAQRHPGLTLIADHMGLSADAVRAGRTASAIDHTLSLARYPNVSVKLSAAPNYSNEPYPWGDMKQHIRRLFDAFGPQRSYWGSDLTNGLAKASYAQRIAHFTQELEFLSEDDKDWVMGRAILARLKWA